MTVQRKPPMTDFKWFAILMLGVLTAIAITQVSEHWSAVQMAKIEEAKKP